MSPVRTDPRENPMKKGHAKNPHTKKTHHKKRASALPGTLSAEVFPAKPGGPFPEFELDDDRSQRYLPAGRPFGVAISGGGTRSLSAAIGQMRALIDLDLLDLVGAVSCVSGGTWFGTLFNYVPETISDSVLLGPSIAPDKLTLADIETLDRDNLGGPVPRMTNQRIIDRLTLLEAEVAIGRLPENRVYARLLDHLLLKPFGLNSDSMFFALDPASVRAIIARNADLDTDDFFTTRTNRPYFLANATQVYPTDKHAVMRHVAYSPLYAGTPQLFTGVGPKGQAFGGGFAQSFAFDSKTPTGSASPVTVPTPSPHFLLSDVMGSSGAAPGAFLDQLGFSDVGFPEFNDWPAVDLGQVPSALYSFVDGGNLEDTGIVSLLYRQYPVIVAFVNAELPIGTKSDEAVDGISGQISRLFGKNPKKKLGNNQDTQVFNNDHGEFAALVQDLNKSRSEGAFALGDYTIRANNAFGIEPYPGDGKVSVLWFYLNLNQDWRGQITDKQVLAVLDSPSKKNNFKNFPNYSTIGQNRGDLDIPELLWLTAEQVQLAANMTAFSVGTSACATLNALRKRFT